MTSQQRYLPFGGVRTDLATPEYRITNTDLGYTGQRNLDDEIGLMDYKFRFYSATLGRFISPDTITPDMTQGLNRYSYVNNRPVNFNDPTGHKACDDEDKNGRCITHTADELLKNFKIKTSGLNEDEKWDVVLAASLVGSKMKSLLGNTFSVFGAFTKTHGNLTISVGQGGPERGNCETNSVSNVIACHGTPNLTNILHEFGHAFDNYFKGKTGNSPSDNIPYEWNGISDGYKCYESPCVEHSSTFDGGIENHKAIEEFADMYMNWVLTASPMEASTTGFARTGPEGLGFQRWSHMQYGMQSMLYYLGLRSQW